VAIRKAVVVYSCVVVRQFLTLKVDRLKWGILWPIWKYMGHPALKQAVPIFCLFFAGAFAMAAGAGPATATKSGSAASSSASKSSSTSTSTTHKHRKKSSGVSAYGDPTKDDNATYDDPLIRQIAVNALGHANGSVLAMDPTTGRILTIVNQKMAFSAGFEPCSTIKPVIALAGLQEGVITRDTMMKVGHRRYMDLTEAMAHSNNIYFEEVGTRLGFPRVHKYAHLLGLGQKAGYNIPEEQAGTLPSAPPNYGGVARMSSFGEGIRLTPLQLASLVSTLANGGTQYYLQYPRTEQERTAFQPKVKQELDIAPLLPDLREGMLAAVMYGTAKQSYDPDEQALGKTGTCNDESLGGRLGWFVSYADEAHPRIVLVVLIRGGGRATSGPHASEIAGRIYHGLRDRNYFAESTRKMRDAATARAAQ
jgi:penicillin-binding protein 2